MIEDEAIIKNYEIKENKIFINYHNGENSDIPYTLWNEHKIIERAKKQIIDNKDTCQKNLKNYLIYVVMYFFLNLLCLGIIFVEQSPFTVLIFGSLATMNLADMVEKAFEIYKNTATIKSLIETASFIEIKEKEFEKKKEKKISKEKENNMDNTKEKQIEELKQLKSNLEGIIHEVDSYMLMNDEEEDEYIKNIQKVKKYK